MDAAIRLYISTLLLFFSFCAVKGQNIDNNTGSTTTLPKFQLFKDQWTFRDGLPDWYGNAYLQDSKGFIWIHTNVGLITFDGLEFRHVPNVDSQPINKMGEDVDGNIWLVKPKVPGKTIEVEVLNPNDYSVMPLHKYLGLENPLEISVEGSMFHFLNLDGIIWIGGGKVCYRYDGLWKKVFDNPVLKFKEKFPVDVAWYPGPEETNWLPTRSGNIALLDKGGTLVDTLDLQGRQIAHYWVNDNKGMWLAFHSADDAGKIYYEYLEVKERKIRRNKNPSPPGFRWVANQFYDWEKHKLIQFGLNLKVQSGKTIPHWENNQVFISPTLNLDIFSNSSIIFVDRAGGIWLSSTDGIVRFRQEPLNAFKTYLSDGPTRYSVRGMTEFNNRLFALTYSGVRSLDLSTGVTKEVYFPFNNLGLALIQYNGNLYVGSNTQYLVKYSRQEEISLVGQKDQFWSVNCFFEHSKIGLLAGTHQGIFLVDTTLMNFCFFALENQSIFHFHLNKEGLWVLGSEGVLLLDRAGKVIKHFLSASDGYKFEMATHLYEDDDGNFWISTRGAGLILLNPKTGATKQFDKKNGFSHANIHAVYADKSGVLWLPSDNGLMRFDPKRNKLRTYYESDGIADNEFNRLSHYRAADGRIFFGGINGITAFYPEQIPWEEMTSPDIKVTSVRSFLLKKGIYVYQSNSPNPNQTFTLKPSDAFLEISISPFLFEDKKDYNYRWKIERVQEKWVEQSSNTIRLNNLPYGSQKIRVQFRRVGNPWSKKELLIPVEVIYPFYLKWPFLTALAAFLVALSLITLRYRTKQLLRDNAMLEHEVKLRTSQIEENLAAMAADKELIRQQTEELKSIDELKSRFFTNVTHELRTPITLILGPVETLVNKNNSAEMAPLLNIIKENARKLLKLVEELLDLSKLESRSLELREEPLLLYPFLLRVIASFTPIARHRALNLSLHYNCPMDTTIKVDVGKWEKILNNLLSNAIKFTPNGGKVEMHVVKTENNIVIEVRDNGSGIDPEDIPFIFDRFYQGKKGAESLQGGTGIGLALSKEYARICNAELTVAETSEKGTTFRFFTTPTFLLPDVKPTEIQFTPPLKPSVFSNIPQNMSQKPSVLIVEDDADMIQFIGSVLENDYHLLAADNGKSALRILKIHHVDLIISDYMMPEMDGMQLLEAVRSLMPEIPFMFLTARVEEADRMQAIQFGVDDYITKPFSPEELKARLTNLISRYQKRKDYINENNNSNEDDFKTFDQKWLHRLQILVDENMGNPLFSVEHLARLLNTSDRTLRNRIKGAIGITPSEFITEARLFKARQLLESNVHLTVAEVCFAVGFETPKYFTKLFKKRFGKLPSEFLDS